MVENSLYLFMAVSQLLPRVSHTSVFWAQNKGSFGQIFGTPVTRVFGTPKIQFCRFYWDENTAFYYFLASDRRASACRERKYLMYITIFYYFSLFFTIFCYFLLFFNNFCYFLLFFTIFYHFLKLLSVITAISF